MFLTNPSLWEPKKIGVQSQFNARFVPYRARAVFASPSNPPPSRHTRYEAYPMPEYKLVHMGPNSQLGGLQEGFFKS